MPILAPPRGPATWHSLLGHGTIFEGEVMMTKLVLPTHYMIPARPACGGAANADGQLPVFAETSTAADAPFVRR